MASLFYLLGLALSGCGTVPIERYIPSPGEARIRSETRLRAKRRSYRLYVPSSWKPDEAWPLVVMIHGAFSDTEAMARETGFNTLAEEENFLVVYPEGMGLFGFLQHWNAGHCCGKAAKEHWDDIGFLNQVIEEVTDSLNVDRSRVYMAGFSNGAMLTYRYVSENPWKVAAFAVVAGSPGGREHPEDPTWMIPEPSRPVPMILLHGDADDRVPYAGKTANEGESEREYTSVEDAIRFWLGVIPHARLHSEGSLFSGAVGFRKWSDPQGDLVLEAYRLRGWGHQWPDAYFMRQLEEENPLSEFRGTQLIWSFFDRHSLPSGTVP